MTIEFRHERKSARLHDPRRNFELVDSQSEVRYDPLTGATGRVCHFSLTELPLPDLAPIIAESRNGCPFCPDRVEAVTPRFPEDLVPGGRLHAGGAVLIPNLYPYDDIAAVTVLCPDHFQPMNAMPEQVVCDGLRAAREFFQRAGARVEGGRAYGLVTWNYMPPAGASQVHPHMQVVLTAHPGNAARREMQAEAEFLRANGWPYAAALLDAERIRGERVVGDAGAVSWLVPWVPFGVFGDCIALFRERATLADLSDADIGDFARSLVRVLRGFHARGLWSFNLSFFPARFGAVDGSHWMSARLLPRFFLNPRLQVTDASYMQLLLDERFSMIHPEATARMLREAFAA